MKKLILILALAFVGVSAQAQIINVQTGGDGKVFQPQPLTIVSGVFTTPAITGGTISGAAITSSTVNPAITTYTLDGAIPLTSGIAVVSKTSAAAMTVAAPGVAGLRITITTGTDFAHVVTFTGATLWDGTAGANTTWTSAAVQGSSITVVSVSASKWNVESVNLGTIAP